MNLITINKRLIGPVRPIGESTEDAERLYNLEQMIELAEELIDEIKFISDSYKNRQEYSIKEAGKTAHAFIKELKIQLR